MGNPVGPIYALQPFDDKDFQKVLRSVAGSGVALYFVAVNTDLNPNEFNKEEGLRRSLTRLFNLYLAAEASFRKALGIARDQGARAFELRTATSLARLLAGQGRAAEALPPLAAVYQTYSEGFETRDLQEARELLDRLSSR